MKNCEFCGAKLDTVEFGRNHVDYIDHKYNHLIHFRYNGFCHIRDENTGIVKKLEKGEQYGQKAES